MNSLQPPLIDTPFRKKRVHFEDQTEQGQNMELMNIDLEVNMIYKYENCELLKDFIYTKIRVLPISFENDSSCAKLSNNY